MTARYRMERNPDSGKNGNKMPLHPRLIPYETVSIKKLMKYAKSRSTYSEADIAGALQLITDLVTEACAKAITWRSRASASSASRSNLAR